VLDANARSVVGRTSGLRNSSERLQRGTGDRGMHHAACDRCIGDWQYEGGAERDGGITQARSQRAVVPFGRTSTCEYSLPVLQALRSGRPQMIRVLVLEQP
jgi:hypothetical protein